MKQLDKEKILNGEPVFPLSEPIIDKPEYLLCSAIRRVEERDCQKVYWPKYQDIYKIRICKGRKK